MLRKFEIWDEAPRRIRHHLEQGLGGHIPETPKPDNRIFRKTRNFIISDNRTACEAVRKALQASHMNATILTSSVDMEAGRLCYLLASIAKDSERFDQPLQASGALVLGGETTVEVKGTGKGGRNQEIALLAVERIAGARGVVISAIGTDGIDGNSPAEGAMIDGYSMARAKRLRLNVGEFLARNDSYNFFGKLGDNIVTGRTGTNVGDLYLVIRK